MISTAAQIRLLCWKNFKIQFRRKIGTVIEIILPICAFAVLIGMKTLITNESYDNFYPNSANASTLQNLHFNTSNYNIIYYTPNAGNVATIMTNVGTNLGITVQGVNNASEINKLGTGNDSTIGVIFDSTDGSLGNNLNFTLRFPTEAPCDECAGDNDKTWNTKKAFTNSIFDNGPVFKSINGKKRNPYVGTGFTRVQYEIQNAFLNLKVPTPIANFNLIDTIIQVMPFKAYTQNNFAIIGIQFALPLLFMLSYLYSFLIAVKEIVLEKELRLKESMKMMGLTSFANWLGWFTKHVVFLFPTAVVVVILVYAGKIFYTTAPYIFIIFYILYLLTFICSAFFVSTWFSNSKTAAAVAGVLFFATFVPYFFIQRNYSEQSVGLKLALCLLPNTCMAQTLTVISGFESNGFDLTFTQFFQTPTPEDNFTIGNCLFMLLFDCIYMFLLTWYIEAVFPGEFGVGEKWYFFVDINYWLPNRKGRSKGSQLASNVVLNEGDGVDNDKNGGSYRRFEQDPPDIKAGVEISHLRKVYDNGKVAVKDLSLNMYEGQITCLLGHNGAGKTTTMSMLTGLYEPTKGEALVNGYNIATDMGKCRESLGLCPQINTLFESLTVREHLEFFGTLKGIKKKQMKESIDKVLVELEMPEKKHNFPSGLSGGMKRKLCVGIAFLGGSKVVFLDEPTSGMDPAARRKTWDVILNNKEGRTICLTTHFLDEADLLGNRIAIMADGQLMTCGSSLFLKNQYGVGYQLIAVKQDNCNTNNLTNIIKEHVPNAQLLNNVGKEISYQLPSTGVSNFATLFTHLDGELKTLGLSSYGVSCTTLEEVFLKVGELFEGEGEGEGEGGNEGDGDVDMDLSAIETPVGVAASVSASTDVSWSTPDQGNGQVESIEMKEKHDIPPPSYSSDQVFTNTTPKIENRFRFFCTRFKALFIKRFINSKKDWKIGVAQLLLPIIFTTLALVLTKTAPSLGTNSETEPSLDLIPSMYPAESNYALDNHYGNYVTGQTAAANVFSTLLQASNYTNITTGQSIQDYIITQQENDIYTFKYGQLASVSLTDLATNTRINNTMYLSGESKHGYGVYLNIMMEDLINYAAGTTNQYTLSITNYPFEITVVNSLLNQILSDPTGYLTAFMMVLGLALLSSSFLIFLVNERKSGAKHVQFVSGVQPKLYWLSTYSWDFVNYLVPVIIIVIIFAGFQIEAYTADGRLGLIFFLLLLYFFALVPLVYLASFVFDIPATGFAVTAVLNILIGLFTLLIIDILRQIAGAPGGDKTLFGVSQILVRVFYIFPNFAFAVGIMDIYKNWQLIAACEELAKATNGNVPIQAEWCTQADKLNQLAANGVYLFNKDYRIQTNYLSTTPPGIGGSLIALFLEGFFFIGVLLFIEYKWKALSRDGKAEQESKLLDEDVKEEMEKVEKMDTYDSAVVIKGLTKIYPKKGKQKAKRAVDNLSLAIDNGECFGLLGVNGAGKTTTFKMLTGDYSPTCGDAFVSGYSVVNNISEVRRNVGYCPQFDALNPRLTGRETLRMYARLRGIKHNFVEEEVQKMIEKLDLTKHCERECGTYSGGNKRKLSTAMALIGNPQVILLDEPTSGVDPATRRFLWDILSSVVREGRAVILTSHSMDECEALCTRLTIMVNGAFKCLGSVQHLKSRFGQGYSIMIKKKFGMETTSLKETVAKVFPAAVLQEEHSGLLNYKLPSQGVTLAYIFTELERLKVEEDVEDYGLSQTSLEQIFLQFAGRSADDLEDVTEDDDIIEDHSNIVIDDDTNINVNDDNGKVNDTIGKPNDV